MNDLKSLGRLATCLALGGALCLLAGPALSRSLAEIQSSGQLRICIAGSSAAFYQANGEAFARFLGVRPEVRQLGSFDEQFQNASGQTERDSRYEPRLFADGTCDVFPNDLHAVNWRLAKMRIVSYYTVRKVVVAHRLRREDLSVIGDLGGKTAAVLKGTSYDDWILEINKSALGQNPIKVRYTSTEDAVRQVAEGQADFTVLGTEGAFKWVRENPANLAIIFPVDDDVEVGWGVSSSAPALARQLARFFEEARPRARSG